jgi:hypothetical protein
MQQTSQKLNIVNVFFEDEQYNYSTNVSSKTTKEDAEKYFVDAWFNIGSFPTEKMRKVIKIEFINQN